MDSREISEWIAFYRINPFGPEREDLRSAIIATVTANANSKKKFGVTDFMPKFNNNKKEKMDWQKMKNVLKKISG